MDARRKLADVAGIAQVELHRGDIVRHPLVQNIVDAYERCGADEAAEAANPAPPAPEQRSREGT
jgi:phosphate starvation-inducible protein PhoH